MLDSASTEARDEIATTNGNGSAASGNGNGNGAVRTLPKPTHLDDALPVISTNGNGFPIAEKLPGDHRRCYVPLKRSW